ncbi:MULTISPECIES: GNAT family N-acetyltransferase [unclassified Streptomyces]|uniref:GNAT family N-acetyltransferase n=1 Tax=unclassified Streptomyces TaxID=2593676 RepID=UPI001BE9EFE7|nr:MULTISPECIES: GNAT family N-acetyltransferase [unclassified Streptomyces]MBT2407675.1 GNAT family N-acetyltransferase [Streptomyces sp. ISL-21]MBT2454833.1 GNAT family N-acetyltransferase [Streptomyces sp. ISL-86]MBT2611643.1 GNAT family N-acetyltransferase [Streptomyces sp. ISL-87]
MSTSALRLEPVTAANIDAVCAIQVRPDQAHLVSPVVKSLAEAYVHGETAWPRAIVDGDEVVGFVMAFLDIAWAPDRDPADIRSGIWRLNISATHQGRGYGRFAVGAVTAELRRRGAARAYVTWEPGAGTPEPFYLGLGFRLTGETSGGQTVGELTLPPA